MSRNPPGCHPGGRTSGADIDPQDCEVLQARPHGVNASLKDHDQQPDHFMEVCHRSPGNCRYRLASASALSLSLALTCVSHVDTRHALSVIAEVRDLTGGDEAGR